MSAPLSNDLESRAAYPTYQDGRWTHGLTKRELFAAMAMQGMLADPQVRSPNFDELKTAVANQSVEFADALLAALTRSQP